MTDPWGDPKKDPTRWDDPEERRRLPSPPSAHIAIFLTGLFGFIGVGAIVAAVYLYRDFGGSPRMAGIAIVPFLAPIFVGLIAALATMRARSLTRGQLPTRADLVGSLIGGSAACGLLAFLVI